MTMLRKLNLLALLAVAAFVLTACESDQKTDDNGDDVSMGALNSACPISGNPVDPDAPTVTYKGNTIGFCCAGCVNGWKKMSDADKQAFVTKYSVEPGAVSNSAKGECTTPCGATCPETGTTTKDK
jgi:hypothetical protein